MNRKTAQAVADNIVATARSRVAPEERKTWTAVYSVPLSAKDMKHLEESPGMVVGCMPLGWSLAGIDPYSLTVTVRRRL